MIFGHGFDSRRLHQISTMVLIRNHRAFAFYNKMLGEHTLYDYLLQLDRDAEDTFNRLINQTAEREGVAEQLKATNQMEWVARMNNIRSRGAEIVNNDIIYI